MRLTKSGLSERYGLFAKPLCRKMTKRFFCTIRKEKAMDYSIRATEASPSFLYRGKQHMVACVKKQNNA
ncbi:hypothetical protein C0679_06405 [Sporolactobacillus terrae]|nr:hypothetical protein C0679_06405 [Sporolactobacillus terrae]